MQINFDIIKHQLKQRNINIDDCIIKHHSILNNNTTAAIQELPHIEASNELFFLITDLKNGTIIQSDEDVLVIGDALEETLVGKSLLAFTGTIIITVPAAPAKQLIEFIRVTPL